ncbi:MAG: YhcN/YlaJ family sporulation lipoprotein [Epulopiscium sp.]|nr:YhcN/YlaJ family sporulation lipoprotein [Candidatus Epulonipiscium sp.]
MKKKYFHRFFIAFVFLSILFGCTIKPQKTGDNIENRLTNVLPQSPPFVSEYKAEDSYRRPDTVVEPVEDTKKAKKIASNITKQPEVEKATVLITGNTALVGIQLSQNLSNDDLDQLKREIESQVKQEQQDIKYVSVTNSPKLVDRMTIIAEDIMEGRPIQGLADEIGVILRRITPTV